MVASILITLAAFTLMWALRELNAEPIPSLVGMVGIFAMGVALVSNLAWAFVCAASWIRWFSSRSAKRG